MREGYSNVAGGRVWYKIVGQKGKAPLVVVHGGPGYPHDYLEPLKALGDEREVVFYDQLGCGKSDRPDDAPTQRDGAEDRRDDAPTQRDGAEDRRDDLHLWTVDRYIRELAELIWFLELKEYHVLGQSWGAALAASFALAGPSGLQKLILSDPYLSTPVWMKDALRLRALLPKDVTEIMDRHEKAGTTDAPEYKEANSAAGTTKRPPKRRHISKA